MLDPWILVSCQLCGKICATILGLQASCTYMNTDESSSDKENYYNNWLVWLKIIQFVLSQSTSPNKRYSNKHDGVFTNIWIDVILHLPMTATASGLTSYRAVLDKKYFVAFRQSSKGMGYLYSGASR